MVSRLQSVPAALSLQWLSWTFVNKNCFDSSLGCPQPAQDTSQAWVFDGPAAKFLIRSGQRSIHSFIGDGSKFL
jgi:hypothetical protein